MRREDRRRSSKNDACRSRRQDDLARVFDARVRVKARFIYATKGAFYLETKTGSVFLYRRILWISPFKRLSQMLKCLSLSLFLSFFLHSWVRAGRRRCAYSELSGYPENELNPHKTTWMMIEILTTRKLRIPIGRDLAVWNNQGHQPLLLA